RGVSIAGNYRRHDRGINHAKTPEPAHAQSLVNHSILFLAHAAGAYGMIGGGSATADKIKQIIVVIALLSRLNLLNNVARHCRRLKDAAQHLDARHDSFAILRCRQIVWMDCWRLSRIGGIDLHKATALWPQQRAYAGHARERMQFSTNG